MEPPDVCRSSRSAEPVGRQRSRWIEPPDVWPLMSPFTSVRCRLPPLVAKTYRRVRDLVAAAEARPAGAEQEELWHDARKAAKQSRYAAESVAPVFGQDATRFAAAVEAVQEALGEHQDSVLTRQRLRELALAAPSTEVAFRYGRLHAQEETRSEQSHEHFRAAWRAGSWSWPSGSASPRARVCGSGWRCRRTSWRGGSGRRARPSRRRCECCATVDS